jgi:trehalose synthase
VLFTGRLQGQVQVRERGEQPPYNALGRHANVVSQKSIREGFGLTLTEGIWKEKPVVALAMGAIPPEQVIDDRTGMLGPDPLDFTGFGRAVRDLPRETERAARIGAAGRIGAVGRAHCASRFLLDRHLGEYAESFTRLCTPAATAEPG